MVKEGQQGLLSAGGALRAELWSDTDSEENEGEGELASFEQPPVVGGVESLSEMRQRLKRLTTIKSV